MSTAFPDEINGVSTKTRAGDLRRRYSLSDQLQMLGASRADLDFFIKLFCPAHPVFAVTRAASHDPRDWTTVKNGQLDDARVVRHLLGDRVPGRQPQWVAPWPTKYTQWIALDIDLHGDDLDDYQRRHDRALEVMIKLGFPRQSLLISATPSGGVHIRGFFSSTVPVADVARLFGLIGVEDIPGRVEIYPHEGHGLRLPFGKLPDQPLDPDAWIDFVRRFQRGEVYTPKWSDVWDRARSIFEQNSQFTKPAEPAAKRTLTRNNRTGGIPCGLPKSIARRSPERIDADRRAKVHKPNSPAEARRMIEEGIPAPGTRVAVTKHVAWHLIKAKGKSEAEAIEFLDDWVYATGEGVSKDVDADLRNGTREVAEQNADIVRWTVRTKSDGGVKSQRRLFPEEVAHIVEQLDWNAESFADAVAFACRALEFAKGYGESTSEGWHACMAAKGVFRKWPRCKGKRYKPILDAVVKRGVMKLVRNEKRSTNGTGRARTYRVAVPSDIDRRSREISEGPLGIDEAIAYAVSLAMAASERRDAESDTYGNVPPLGVRRQRERTTHSKRDEGNGDRHDEIAAGDPDPLELMRERQRRPISSRLMYGPEPPTIRRPTVNIEDIQADLQADRQAVRDEMRRSVMRSVAVRAYEA